MRNYYVQVEIIERPEVFVVINASSMKDAKNRVMDIMKNTDYYLKNISKNKIKYRYYVNRKRDNKWKI